MHIDRFRVESTLGSGGMATVYLASDPKLERKVAVKVLSDVELPAEFRAENETINLRERPGHAPSGSELLREARVMAKLAHPNVLPIYEVGAHEGQLFLVTEYVAGLDGRHWLNEDRAIEEILDLFAQAGSGLVAAHEAGIVHRDFKPENVLVGDDGRVRVADFGISALLASESRSMVRRKTKSGTPEYMAPELDAGGEATPASDVYSFALSVVEAVLGVRPDPGERADQDEMTSLLRARGLSNHSAALAVRALSDDPAQRPGLEELLESFVPAKRRTNAFIVGAASVAVLLAASVLVVTVLGKKDSEATCDETWSALESAWSAADRANLEAVALASGRSHASKTRARIAGDLDRYVEKLAQLRMQGCQARKNDELTSKLYASRLECLERAAFELGDLTNRLQASGTAEAFDGLSARVDGLPEPSDCLSSSLREARDPQQLERSRGLHQRLLDIRADRSGSKEALLGQVESLSDIATEAEGIEEVELVARAQLGVAWRQKQLGELDAAEAAYQRVFDITNVDGFEEYATEAVEGLARVATRRGDRKAARQLARIATGLSQRFEARPRLQAKLLATIGDIERISGNYNEAIESLKKARETLNHDQEPNHLTIGRVEADLCSALRYAKRVEESLIHCERSVEHLLEVFGSKEHVRVAVIEANVGLSLQELGRFDEALEIQHRTQKIVEEAYGSDHHAAVNGRSNIATTYFTMGQFDQALETYLEVLKVAESGKLGSFRTRALGNIGNLYHRQSEFDKARDYLTRAVESGRAVGGADHPDVARYLQDLSQTEVRLGDLESAANSLEKAAVIIEKRWGIEHVETATVLWRQADLALDRGDYADSVLLGERSLEVYVNAKAKKAVTARVHLTLAQSQNALQKWPEALAAADAALDIYGNSEGSTTVAFARFNKARAEYGLRRNRPAAVKVARESLAMLAKYPYAKPWADVVRVWFRRRK